MKTPLKSLAIFLQFQIVIGLFIIGFAPASRAGLNPPYTPDFYTLHLWHLQDTNGTIVITNGTITGVTNGVYFNDSQSNNAMVVPLQISNYVSGGNAELAGQPGPGAPLLQQYGSDFGYTLSVQTTQSCALAAPLNVIGTAIYPNSSYVYTNNSCSFVNTNTGAYTWEALIQANFNPLVASPIGDTGPEILCTDGGNSSLNPYTIRACQFRIDVNTPANKNEAQLEWNGNISSVPNAPQIHDVEAPIPTAGPDQFIEGNWYHVAVAFTGTSPTNGDPTNVLTLYWTSFYPFHTNADVLTNFGNYYCITNSAGHFFSETYPSNSIVGTGPFIIGNIARNFNGGWIGNIAEVRISDYYRHSNEFEFNSTYVPTAPVLAPLPASTLVGYGQNLSLNLPVAAATTPWVCQYYSVSGGVTNLLLAETNLSSIVVSNITYAANTTTYFAVVTNVFGSATSTLSTVTVGATFDGLFNTGCGPNDNPLDQTAPGSVDLHWMFSPNGNQDTGSSNAIVWSDGGPLASGGGVGPDNGASVWIWAHENSGRVSGTYSLQTSFQVDETVVKTNSFISGIVGALGAAGGTKMQMFLNGVETDYTLSGNPAETLYPFSITNGLLPGTNTLICTCAQTGLGTAGNNAFNMGIITDIGVALTNAPIITNQPASVTNFIGSTVSFSAVALGAPPLNYYWLSNGVPVTPLTWVYTAVPYLSFVATNFSLSQLVGTNYFANYQVVFSNFVGTATSGVATLDVEIPPLTLASAGAAIWSPTNTIVVYFSGAVDPGTGTNAANYTVTGGSGATVLSATLGGAPGEVVLTVTGLTPGTSYTVNVQNVNSTYGFVMNPSPASIAVGTYPTNVALWVKASQGVTTVDTNGDVSQWNDLSGNGNNLMTGGSDPQLVSNAIDGQPMVEFTGTNGTYLIANDSPSLEITGDMSIFAVMNFATLAGGTNGDIVTKGYTNNEPAPYDYYVQPGSVRFLRGNGTANGLVASTTSPFTGIPHILDVVMQGTNVIHRLDGNPNGSGSLSAVIADKGQPLSIGAREDLHNFLTGGMAELILVGQALSPSDVVSMESYLSTEYSIALGISTVPTNIVTSLANNQLTLSWPKDHQGWQLQAQTNDVSVGISTNWVNVAGTTATNQIVIPINITNGTVFYRLMYP